MAEEEPHAQAPRRDSSMPTSSTLLRRIKDPGDQQAWHEFVDRYAPTIYAWCARYGLQTADIEDVCQEIVTRLYRALARFEYDRQRSFRGYLHRVTRHALADFFADRAREARGAGGSEVARWLASVEAREDLLSRLRENFAQAVWEEATREVRQQVEARTWEVYERLTQGEKPDGVAHDLEMTLDAVYKAKSRVNESLRKAVERAEAGGE